MKRHRVFQMVPLALAMIALLVVCAGCEKKKGGDERTDSSPARTHAHNLKFVKCSSQNGEGENVTIEVTAATQLLQQADDRLVFVCPGEMLTWHTSSPNTTIEVHFKDNKLFKSHDTDITSLAGSGGDAATAPEEVVDTAKADSTHGYTIKVTKGSDVFEMDPHIIPVGN